MNVRTRATNIVWQSLVLAAAFALLQLVNLEHEFPSQWPLKVSLGFVVVFLIFAPRASRSGGR